MVDKIFSLLKASDPNTVRFSAEATKYFTGGYLPMMFGLPAAALAMYRVADDKNKKRWEVYYSQRL